MTQAEALKILKTGGNVFLTGEPGSGKTHTINTYVKYLREQGVEPAITASTGIAATHLNGLTIHSWSGIGIKEHLTSYDLDKLEQNERVSRRVRGAKVLIIDEISMLSAATLGMVERVCRELRSNDDVFGGLQVILVGDFFQLPPVGKGGVPADFAFRSPVWLRLNLLTCYLAEQHRQEDKLFLTILSALRSGSLLPEHRDGLKTRLLSGSQPVGVTKLFSHNANVDQINELELNKSSNPTREFKMTSKGPEHLVDGLKRSCLSPERLQLKVGAKVMFTKNSPDGKFVNGTVGEVASFNKTSGYPVVKIKGGKSVVAEPAEWVVESEGKILAAVSQVPLRLAWAITVHKSQGMSLSGAVVDLSQAFEYGQGYVALSRVRSLDGLHLLGFNERALEVHPQVLSEDESLRAQSAKVKAAFRKLPADHLKRLHTNFIKTIKSHSHGR
jgi:ATP-dependent exoDNAse (exonuclease V) alpha subunit